MRRADARVLLACALSLLAACGRAQPPVSTPPAVMAPVPVPAPADAGVERAQSAAAQVLAPAIVAVREAVQEVLPPSAQVEPSLVSPAAVALIVRWEVTGADYYERRLQRPVWPGGASGITWGIGYDGGHQTPYTIGQDWWQHPQSARLGTTSGLLGDDARVALPRYRDIVTPFPLAESVFANVSLPVYRTTARRVFRADAFDALPADAAGSLVSLTYNRGGSMVGERNREKRVIRDECLPTGDVRCIAAQLRAMCRLWAGTPNERGLCGRREDEAQLAEAAR